MASACSQEQKLAINTKNVPNHIWDHTRNWAAFYSSLRVKAEATIEAIALSTSINQATPQQQLELAKASG